MDYEELKKRLKVLGFSMKEFTNLIDTHETTATKWKNNGVPTTILKVLEGLEYKAELDDTKQKLKSICSENN